MNDPKWEIGFVCGSVVDSVGKSQATEDVVDDGIEEQWHGLL